MKIQGAVVREQGVPFAIVIVKKHVVDNRFSADEAISNFSLSSQDFPLFLPHKTIAGYSLIMVVAILQGFLLPLMLGASLGKNIRCHSSPIQVITV